MPGSNTIYVVSKTIERGIWHGVYATLAIGLGSLLYALAVAIGLGTVISQRPDVLTGIQLLGVVYLLYLGIRAFWTISSSDESQQHDRSAPGRNIFLEALTVCLLNPKVVVFLLAFLPQFVTEETASYRLKLAMLGTLFALLGTLWASALAVGSGLLGSRLGSAKLPSWVLKAASGSLLIGLSVLIALEAMS